MRWLHISDLHMEEASGKQNYFVDALKKSKKPDFIVVTGDLRSYPEKSKSEKSLARVSTYDLSKEFLCDLLKHWKLTEDDLFIVPGNHDVDETAHDDALHELYSSNPKFPKYDNSKESSFQFNNTHLKHRFCQYAKFIKEFFPSGHEAAKDSAGVFIRTWRGKINLLHVNTALYSTSNNANELHCIDTLSLSRQKLSGAQEGLPTLLLGHHSFFRLLPGVQNDVKPALEKLNVVAYLCGDAHMDNTDTIDLDSGRKIPCITCLVSAIDTSFWSDVGFLEYSWDEEPCSRATVSEFYWRSKQNKSQSLLPTLTTISMDFGKQSNQTANLQHEIKEQIEHLDPKLLPGLKDETRNISYINNAKEDRYPLAELLFSDQARNCRRFYLFEGNRTTRGGTGKTSSLLSVYKAEELCKEFQPVYIRLRSLYQDTLSDRIEQQTGDRMGRKYLLLLDGFDEITSSDLRQKCVKEILDWSDRYYTTDAIIVTGRDPLEVYFQTGDIQALRQEDIDRFLGAFDNYKVLEMTPEQRKLCLAPPLPDEADKIWDILDNPFFVSRYREGTQSLEKSAARWKSPQFSEWLNTAKSKGRTSLMLGSLLYEVNRLGVGTGAAVERKRFILTKLLPALAYRKLLADKTLDSGMPIDGKRILEREYIMDALPSLLNMYSSILRFWPEYHSQSERDNFYSAWETYWEPGIVHMRTPLNKIEYFIGPLTLDKNGDYCFTHAIYQEFFAAFHLANIVYAVCNGMKISDTSEVGMDLTYVQVEHMDHHILIQTEEILEQYWGMPFCSKELQTCNACLSHQPSSIREKLVLCQLLIRFLDAKTTANISEPQKVERHKLYEYFRESFLQAIQNSLDFRERYKQFYLYVTTLLARDYRKGVGCPKDIEKCEYFANLALKNQLEFQIPRADGYLQMGLFLNAAMEQLINDLNFQPDHIQKKYDSFICKANEILKLVEAMCHNDDQAVIEIEEKYTIHTSPTTLSRADSYYELLKRAQQAYYQCEACPHQLKLVRKLGYISKAYLVLAALGSSGGAFNSLGLMFSNQANALEHYPQTAIYREIRLSALDLNLSSFSYSENQIHSYKMFQTVYGIRRGDQPYSSVKVIELILKGRVFVGNGLDHPIMGDGKRISKVSPYIMVFLEQAAQKADNGLASLSNYWHGRILLLKANMDSTKRISYLRQACDLFRKEEYGSEQIEYISYNEYLIEEKTLPTKIMLAAIELLDPAIRAVDSKGFYSNFNDICMAILLALEKQFKRMYLNSEMPIFTNEQYCLMPVDVMENIDRFEEVSADLLDDTMHRRLAYLRKKVHHLNKIYFGDCVQ